MIRAQVETLRKAEISQVPLLIEGLKLSNTQTIPQLKELLRQSDLPATERFRVSLAMLVLANDQDQVAFLGKQLLAAEPAELLVTPQGPAAASRALDRRSLEKCAQDSEVGKGQPLSGRRLWRPLILRRRAGSASPTLWQASPSRRIRGPCADLGKCLAARARCRFCPP